MEIIEGNKLIADFMGAKYNKDTNFPIHPDDLWLPVHGINNYKTITIGAGKILRYHSSWDWLMPVVKLCYTINYDKAIITFEYLDFLTGNINLTWIACIEFIQWYNETNK